MKGSRLLLALLLLSSCVPFFYGLGWWPLIEPDEGRNAEVAREMLTRASWAVPYFNGLPFLDKPVALFWMIAAAFRVFGVSELSARLPSAVGAMALVATTFSIGRMLLGTQRGLLAALVVATSPLVLIFGRLSIFDMPFTALVTLTIWCLLHVRLGGSPRVWLPLAGLTTGLAVLTKGPVGIVVPLLAWFAGRGALPELQERPGVGIRLVAVAVAGAVVVPWVAAVMQQEPDFLRYALLDETVLRFTSAARFHRGGPFYFHAVGIGLGLGIWTCVLAALSPGLVRRARNVTDDAGTIRFAVRAAAAILLFFSICASKRPGYVLPAMVPLSLLVAIGVSAEPRRAAATVRTVAFVAVVGVLAAAIGALAGHDALDLGRRLRTSPLVARTLTLHAAVFLFVWGLAAIWAARNGSRLALAAGAALGPGLYLALLVPLTAYAEGRSARMLARRIVPAVDVVALGTFRTSLPFYLGHPVELASLTGRELTSNYIPARYDRFLDQGVLLRPSRLWERLGEAQPIYVLVNHGATERLTRRAPHPYVAVGSDRRSLLVVSGSDPWRTRRLARAATETPP